MSLSSAVDHKPRNRTPKKSASAEVKLPAKAGKFWVALKRGQRYHLAGDRDQIFEQGQVREVDEATYNHLATHAVDRTSYLDGELGRVGRIMRKFQFSPPIDEIVSLTYLDLEDEPAAA